MDDDSMEKEQALAHNSDIGVEEDTNVMVLDDSDDDVFHGVYAEMQLLHLQ
jgi:hypothetical protein